MLARYTLAQPFLQAFAGVAIPFAIVTAIVAHAPVGVALITFLPAVPTIAMVMFEAAGLREFCRVYYVRRPGALDYARLFLGAPVYQVVLAVAACRAAVRELRGRRGWEKTEHSGAHRDPDVTPLVDAPRPQRRAA
jgi:hypothetical protein